MTRRTIPLLVCLLAAAPAWADDPPSFALTTDTPQYCAQLAKQITDRHSAIPDVGRLLSEGTDMCGRGQIRGGIRRLRRALVMLHHRKVAKEPQTKAPSPGNATKAPAPGAQAPPQPAPAPTPK